ncbi:MAG TPA: glutamate formimidoyltransferase, partial [Calditrichaeota bacterium]|nr:glutamate formimidoyltransferase [Calditrichota bacterium]
VSRESAAPGGGSIAALAGSLGAALSSMVANLTANRRGSEAVDAVLNQAAEKAQELKFQLANGVDADTNAFNVYMEARRLPKATEEQKKRRLKAEQDGLKRAVQIPLQTAEASLKAIEIAQTVVQYGNPNSITDVGVGAQMAYAGVKGGVYNVLINLKDITDDAFVKRMKQTCALLEEKAAAKLNTVLQRVEAKIL